MAKTIQTRVQNKHDIEANWLLATNFVPLAGEIIIYDDLQKVKIGDGQKNINELEWLTLTPNEILEKVGGIQVPIFSVSGTTLIISDAIPTAKGVGF